MGRRALLLAGEQAAALRDAGLPDSIAAFDYAPHSVVMPRAGVIVHQGGVGTTGQALRAGRPMLIVPFGQDQPDNARRFLGRYGNPFSAAGADQNGRASIEWGVYGVPETFLVDRDGRIAYKLVGPITPQNFDSVLKPEIEKALKKGE